MIARTARISRHFGNQRFVWTVIRSLYVPAEPEGCIRCALILFAFAFCTGCKQVSPFTWSVSNSHEKVASAQALRPNKIPVRLASLTIADVEDLSKHEKTEQLPPPVQIRDDGLIEESELRNESVADADYFVSLALASHPRIHAAQSRVTAALHRIPQARSLPDPQLNNTFWPIHDQAIQTAAGRIGNQMSLEQAVPWPHKLDAKAAVAYQQAQVAMASVAEIESEIVELIRLAYAEYWFATRAIEIVKQNIALVDDLTRIAVTRNKAGGSQQDVLRAELEADKLSDQLITLHQKKKQAAADLAALINQPIGQMPDPIRDSIVDGPDFSLDDCVARAEAANPELRGLFAKINQDRAKQRLAGLQRYPDLKVGIQWGLVDDNTSVISPVANGADNVGFTVGVTLPIRHERINAGICEAAAERQSTMQLNEATRAELFGKIRRLIAQADALTEQLELFTQRIVPRAEQAIRIATTDYTAGRSDFASLTDLFQERLAYQTQIDRARATLFATHAQIRRAIGE